MKNSVIRNLQIGYGFSLLLLIISGIASSFSIQHLQSSAAWVSHTREVMGELEVESSIIKDAESGQRGYLLTGDRNFLDPYVNAAEKSVVTMQKLQTLTQDNPVQQKNMDSLQKYLDRRFNLLQELIAQKDVGGELTIETLRKGNRTMNSIREITGAMKNEEERLLNERTSALAKITNIIPFVIFAASLIAIIITIYSYRRVLADFKMRAALSDDLIQKDKEISKRIDIIQQIAGSISEGDYKIRVKEDQKDNLGILSASLNKMAQSLDHSFELLKEREWLQTGIAGLNEKMLGEQELRGLAANIIGCMASYTNAQAGALYLFENKMLHLYGTYSLHKTKENEKFAWGEGMVGQCATGGEPVFINRVSTEFQVSFAEGNLYPAAVILFPFYHDKRLKGVIELGTVTAFAPKSADYLAAVAENTGIAIHSAQSRARIQSLLEEVQAQSEELQAQHEELENSNTEMEAQSMKLQASEEELRVQQEELMQTNQELEERSRSLEERNQLVAERNIEIRKKAEELELSSKYKSEFLANMSHELRTPLNSILLLSRLLGENNNHTFNAEEIESAQVIHSSGVGLLQLIDEILDLSKIESGKMSLEYGMIAVSSITGHMRQLFDPVAKEKKIDFVVVVNENLPATIETDEQRLEQILKNLLSNAFKFTSRGSVRLEIKAAAHPGYIEFSVKDTGVGIASEKQQLIFEAFQQADGSTRRKYGGTGLGLSISRELVKLLGGSISVSSVQGSGSEFVIALPVMVTDKLVLEEPVEIAAPVAAVAEKDPFISGNLPADIPDDRKDVGANDKVILIVEDDIPFAKTLLGYARDKGYKAVVAVRGDQVKELAMAYKPVAILLDIVLPIKSGWDVLEELKANSLLRHIPVHIMSSMEAKKESLRRGAIDFIDKPMAAGDLQRVFNKLEKAILNEPGKVLIVEDNQQHAKALAYFLETNAINAEIKGSVDEGITALQKDEVQCVILDMGIPDQTGYETLERIKNNQGLENLPIIIFTGKSLSKSEEARIRKYADTIIIKTAHSYQRMLDEVGLFLHQLNSKKGSNGDKISNLNDILKNKTVLITDDDVRNIYSLTKALELQGVKVLAAMDGREALQLLDSNPQIELVLMDIMMPGIDGYEAIRQIRKRPKWRNLPVLAVTAKAMLGDREKCIQAGASDYISKPVDIDQLLSLLRVWLYDKGK